MSDANERQGIVIYLNIIDADNDNINEWENEPQHDKTNKMACAPSEDCPVWSESSLSERRNTGS